MNAIEFMRALIDGYEVDVGLTRVRLSEDGAKIEYRCVDKDNVTYKTLKTGTYVEPKYTWREYLCFLNIDGAKLTGFDLSFQEAVEAMKKGECCVRSEKPWDVYCMDFEDGPLIRVSNYNPTASFSHIASLNMDEISDKWKIKPKYE